MKLFNWPERKTFSEFCSAKNFKFFKILVFHPDLGQFLFEISEFWWDEKCSPTASRGHNGLEGGTGLSSQSSVSRLNIPPSSSLVCSIRAHDKLLRCPSPSLWCPPFWFCTDLGPVQHHWLQGLHEVPLCTLTAVAGVSLPTSSQGDLLWQESRGSSGAQVVTVH